MAIDLDSPTAVLLIALAILLVVIATTLAIIVCHRRARQTMPTISAPMPLDSIKPERPRSTWEPVYRRWSQISKVVHSPQLSPATEDAIEVTADQRGSKLYILPRRMGSSPDDDDVISVV